MGTFIGAAKAMNDIYPGTVNVFQIDFDVHNLTNINNQLHAVKLLLGDTMKLAMAFEPLENLSCENVPSDIIDTVDIITVTVKYSPNIQSLEEPHGLSQKILQTFKKCKSQISKLLSKNISYHLSINGGRHKLGGYDSEETKIFSILSESRLENQYVLQIPGFLTFTVDSTLRVFFDAIGIIIISIVIIIAALIYGDYLKHRRIRKMTKTVLSSELSSRDIYEFRNGVTKESYEIAGFDCWLELPYNNKELELAKEDFCIEKEVLLGSGVHGSVYKGSIRGLDECVAFKTIREQNKSSGRVLALKGLLSEIKVLDYIGKHDNIIVLIGAYTEELKKGSIYVATELCCKGSLEKYLRVCQNSNSSDCYATVVNELVLEEDHVTVTFQDEDLLKRLIRFGVEICRGMEFIASKNVVHADLATRNVLLTSSLTVKICDFGLSRRLYDYSNYKKKQQEPLPWKWMAPETLDCLKFSEKSDVWAYGITLWEIFSLGNVPYAGSSWHADFSHDLKHGLRLHKPELCSNHIYEIMLKCWQIKVDHRPSFADLIMGFVQ